MHPLANDLTKLKDDELQTKYGELSKRLSQCFRFGPQGVIPQLQMLMQDYQDEINKRTAKTMQEISDKTGKDGKGYNSIIDIS